MRQRLKVVVDDVVLNESLRMKNILSHLKKNLILQKELKHKIAPILRYYVLILVIEVATIPIKPRGPRATHSENYRFNLIKGRKISKHNIIMVRYQSRNKLGNQIILRADIV